MTASAAVAGAGPLFAPPPVRAALDPATRPTFPAATLIVVRRGWHIEVGFAVNELAAPLAAMAAVFGGASHVFFGFGDRQYLVAHRHGAPVLLRALWPGSGLILVTGLQASPAAAFGISNVRELQVSPQGLLRAQAWIWNSLTPGQRAAVSQPTGAPSGIPGPYEGSIFFESNDTYSAAHTCNTWAAEAIEQAGMPVHSRGVIFAGQLWRQLERPPAYPVLSPDLDPMGEPALRSRQ